MNTKNYMKMINKQLILLIYYIVNVYKIISLIKTNMKVYVIFLQDMQTKQKMILFYKHEHKNKIKLF